MATKLTTKDKLQTTTMLEDCEDLLAMGAGSGSGGSGNGGIGGGGGSPGGGTPGGGGGGGSGGKPGGEGFGNNLSFPAIFFDDGAPTLRGTEGAFTFGAPTNLAGDSAYVYFAQGVEGNTWQAGNDTTAGDIVVDYVDIGDALESAPLKTGTNVRLELTLYQDLLAPDAGELVPTDSMTAFAMTLLGGAKGSGKPSVVGPTESQGARLPADLWDGSYDSTTDAPPPANTTTFESDFASVYAADTTGGETANSYMSLSVQKVTGLAPGDDVAGLGWDGLKWVDEDVNDGITVGANIVNTAFGPELNIAGKYIMGASGKPFKFTADGNYLITFALEDGTPVIFDAATTVANDGSPDVLGFQPLEAEGRYTQVIEDAANSYTGGDGDTHNGLLVMLVGIPSTIEGGE